MEKRLYRSRNNRMLAGICGGIANYFNIDPVIVRIFAVICLLAFNIMAVIAYIILIFIIPLEGADARA
jgi:phage shock protein C